MLEDLLQSMTLLEVVKAYPEQVVKAIEGFHKNEEAVRKLALHAPAAHSLVECLKELKFGRPAKEQMLLDELINVTTSRLGSDGPGFPPEILNQVFNV